MRAISQNLFLIILLFMTSGCITSLTAATGAAVIQTASFIHTDKLPSDHIAEAATGMDCSYVRQLDDGGDLCRPLRQEVVEADVFCYRELGGVVCYDSPNPYGDDKKKINTY